MKGLLGALSGRLAMVTVVLEVVTLVAVIGTKAVG